MASTSTRDQGKTTFLKEFLLDHPQANPTAANAAWARAGMSGTISASLVNKLRAQLGLTGNLKAGRKRKGTTSAAGGVRKTAARRTAPTTTTTRPNAEASDLAGVDADLDRLIFRVMSIQGLQDVADRLRDSRRALYAHFIR